MSVDICPRELCDSGSATGSVGTATIWTVDVLGHPLRSDFTLFQKTPVSDITGESKHN